MERCLMLKLPVGDGTESLMIRAEEIRSGVGSAPVFRILELMANLLRLSPERCAGEEKADVVLREQRDILEPGAIVLPGAWKFPGRFVLLPGGDFAIELNAAGEFRRNTALALIRFALTFAGVAAMSAGKDLAFLHGSAVRFADSGGAVLFFGPSGIGKSTALRRFALQGGHGIADDMLLLSFSGGNELMVQPLPTWSELWYPADYTKGTVPVSEFRRVEAVIELGRGVGDQIVPCELLDWKVNLVKALHNHPGAVLSMLIAGEKSQLSVGLVQFAARMAGLFPPVRMLGDLHGDIYRNLSAFCRDGRGNI